MKNGSLIVQNSQYRQEEFIYPPMVDCGGRTCRIVAILKNPNAVFANTSLFKACNTLKSEEKRILQTDQRAYYRCHGWIGITENFGRIRSMSKKECSPDNAACEGLFDRFKNDFFMARLYKRFNK